MLAGKLVPLGLACKTPVQRWVLYIYHHENVDGLTKENKVTEVVEHIGMPIEHMEPPCFSTQDGPEFNLCQPVGVWFTDRSAHKIQGKWQGMAAADFVAEEPVVTEPIKGFAQLAELYAIVLALRNGAQAIYTDSYAVWARMVMPAGNGTIRIHCRSLQAS